MIGKYIDTLRCLAHGASKKKKKINGRSKKFGTI
jgi:hypothetical protein